MVRLLHRLLLDALENIIAMNPHVNSILGYPTFRSSTMGVGYLSFKTLMPRSHQTFRLAPTMKLLETMLRNRCWPTTFHTTSVGNVDEWCPNWLELWQSAISPFGCSINDMKFPTCLINSGNYQCKVVLDSFTTRPGFVGNRGVYESDYEFLIVTQSAMVRKTNANRIDGVYSINV